MTMSKRTVVVASSGVLVDTASLSRVVTKRLTDNLWWPHYTTPRGVGQSPRGVALCDLLTWPVEHVVVDSSFV